MKFPIAQEIEALPYGNKTGTVLHIAASSGGVPNAFQFYVFASQHGEAVSPMGISAMTDAQWDAWSDQENRAYILQCVAENEGFTLVGEPFADENDAEAAAPDITAPRAKTRRRK